jgi:hypothetical protein
MASDKALSSFIDSAPPGEVCSEDHPHLYFLNASF